MPSWRVTADPSPTPLSDSIRAHIRDKGLSIRALALRSVDPGTRQHLTAQWITDVLSGRVPRMPDLWRLNALATGLGLDPDTVKALAITQWIGWDIADIKLASGERLIFRVPGDYTDEQCDRLADELGRALDPANKSDNPREP
ncbi:hypothetical protein Sru01_59770 [Sphaerisporangium rufum]|uniref:Uncharacterized protein n=1 Tax=Sphaerisporangium rufum TaxID=1381558 RepID=A0A919RA58_9ACTN|nr:helix-turn-helix transcriptional regulator [Sphaerisporangium rufum]GII80995.1 hypothetical protein Sru01_59770 [Sphaerisporangium rufum]